MELRRWRAGLGAERDASQERPDGLGELVRVVVVRGVRARRHHDLGTESLTTTRQCLATAASVASSGR